MKMVKNDLDGGDKKDKGKKYEDIVNRINRRLKLTALSAPISIKSGISVTIADKAGIIKGNANCSGFNDSGSDNINYRE